MKQKIMGIAILSALILSCTGCDSAKTAETSSANDTSSHSVSDVEDEPEATTAEVTDATEAVSDSGAANSGGGTTYDNGEYQGVKATRDEDGNLILTNEFKLVPVPDAEPTHPDINFGIIATEDGETYDVFAHTPKEFREQFDKMSSKKKLIQNSPDFYFWGMPYRVDCIHLELIMPDGDKIYSDAPNKEITDKCTIKGFGFDDYSSFNIQGVTVGMSSIYVEELLGKGIEGCTFVDKNDGDDEKYNVIYKSKTTTLVVTYEASQTIEGKPIGVVSDLFAVKND